MKNLLGFLLSLKIMIYEKVHALKSKSNEMNVTHAYISRYDIVILLTFFLDMDT